MTVVETPYGIQNGEDAFDQVLATAQRPSVVMCGNDVLAVGALRRATELGICVPDDLSITGFDDIELASIVTPNLTTVHVPHRAMGRKAAVELVKMVEQKTKGPSVELSTTLELRASLAPPNKS